MEADIQHRRDVVAEYAKLPLIPPYLQPGNHQFGYGANFASGGAGALDETNPGLVINLNTQLTYFKDVEKQLMHKLVGCLPAFRSASGHCNEELATLVKLHNEALHNILHKLDRQLKGFRYSYFDLYTVSLDLIKNPSKYVRFATNCGRTRRIAEYKLCTNASEYLFFDSGHPTEAANDQIAKLIWSGNRTIAWPYNLKKLFKS
ncbi:hypothetical protein RJ640_023667 [Escallonia rubra]|uniref:GDSL esterase/lipase n=1 Tax=Escallonia rubra TaxID=112253 RepID=A0AA88U450_9ASTE|nr:hypothetical protein RJ640_023667 [Escallonia rubra]